MGSKWINVHILMKISNTRIIVFGMFFFLYVLVMSFYKVVVLVTILFSFYIHGCINMPMCTDKWDKTWLLIIRLAVKALMGEYFWNLVVRLQSQACNFQRFWLISWIYSKMITIDSWVHAVFTNMAFRLRHSMSKFPREE